MSSSTPSIVLRLSFPQEELAVLKTLAVGYQFDNINDYLHFALKRAVSEDVVMYNDHVKEYNDKLRTAQLAGEIVVGGELGPDGLAIDGTGVSLADAQQGIADQLDRAEGTHGNETNS